MKTAGTVEFVQMVNDDFGRPRGVGMVRYATEEEALYAIDALNGSTMPGMRPGQGLQVDLWTGKKPETKKGSAGMAKGACGGGAMKGGFGGAAAFGGGCGMAQALQEAFMAGMRMGAGAGAGCGKGGKGGKGGCAAAAQPMLRPGGAAPNMKGGGVFGKDGKFYPVGGGAAMGKGPAMMANIRPTQAAVKGGGGGKGKQDPTLKVKVLDLPPGCKWQELKDHFKQAGTVEFTNTRGSEGEVRFATAEEAENAIDLLNGSELMEGIITVVPWE